MSIGYEDDDPPEPDWGYEEWLEESRQHIDQAHGAGQCNCIVDEPLTGPAVFDDKPPF